MRLIVVAPGDSPHTQPWLDTFVEAGHEVLVYAYPPVTQDFAGAEVRTVEGGGPLGRARWLRRAVRADDPDVLSMHFVGSDAVTLAWMGRPLVLSTWGSDILVEFRNKWLKRVLISAALRRADLVIAPAAHMRDRLMELRVRPGRILVAQYGVDTALFAPPAQTRSAPVTVITTRQLKPVYGNEDIVRAAALVDPRLVARFLITGDGSLRAQLLAEAQSAAVPVDLLGTVDHAGLPELLHQGDIYCSMSRSDGTSLSLLEAMAAGLPAVLSDIPANREWADGSAILVPVGRPDILAEALESLAGDPDRRRSMGAVARRTVLERGDLGANMLRILEAVETLVR